MARDLAAPVAALDPRDSSTYSIVWSTALVWSTAFPRALSLAARSYFVANTRLGTNAAPFGGEPLPSLGDPKLSMPIDFPA